MKELRTPPYAVDLNKGILLNIDSSLGAKGSYLTAGRFFEGFMALPPNGPERTSIGSWFLSGCIENPEQMISFAQLISSSPQLREKPFIKAMEAFTKETSGAIKKLPRERTTEIAQDTHRLGYFLDMHSFDKKIPPPDSSPVETNKVHKTFRGLDEDVISMMRKISRETIKRTFDNCETQKEVVDVLYNSAVHLLRDEATQNWDFLIELLTFQSQFLGSSNNKTGWYVAAEISADEDIFMKYYWLNSTLGILMQLIREPYQMRRFNERAAKIVETNEGFKEMRIRKSEIMSMEKMMKYAEREKNNDQTDWHEKLTRKDGSELSEYLAPIDFPDTVITRPNPLMFLTKRLIAQYYQNSIEDIVSVVFPTTNTVHNVFIEKGKRKDVSEKPKTVMHYVYQNGPGGEICNPYTIADALRWFRPELLGTTFIRIEKVTIPQIKKRLNRPQRSIPASGIHMTFNTEAHPFMEVDSLDIDRSGKNITMKFGNYTIPFTLDAEGHLKAQDGSEIDLEYNARCWWEAAILSAIADVTSPIEGDEVILTDAAEMPRNEAVERTDRAFVLRGPHMRELHAGQGFDVERAIDLLNEEFPFPHSQQPVNLFERNGVHLEDDSIPRKIRIRMASEEQRKLILKGQKMGTYVHEAKPKDEREAAELKKKKSINLVATQSSLSEIHTVIETQLK